MMVRERHALALYNELTFQFETIPTFGADFNQTSPESLIQNQAIRMNLRHFFLLCALFAGQFLSAQSGAPGATSLTNSDPEVRNTTAALVTKYSLNADQAKQMYKIQLRKNRNMSEIASLQSKDLALYQAKWNNVQKGTWVSIRGILNTKEQVNLYRKTQGELRGLRNAKRKELTAQKVAKEVVESAVLAIYAE